MAMGLGIVPVVNVAAAHQALVLAVGHNELAQGLGPSPGLLHSLGILHAPSIVREGHHMGGQFLQSSQGLSLLPHCNGGVGVGVDHCVSADNIQLGLEGFQAVGHRLQVGHGAHSREAPMGPGPGAGSNGFFV